MDLVWTMTACLCLILFLIGLIPLTLCLLLCTWLESSDIWLTLLTITCAFHICWHCVIPALLSPSAPGSPSLTQQTPFCSSLTSYSAEFQIKYFILKLFSIHNGLVFFLLVPSSQDNESLSFCLFPWFHEGQGITLQNTVTQTLVFNFLLICLNVLSFIILVHHSQLHFPSTP